MSNAAWKYTNYHHDLPQLKEEELKSNKNAFEWWYFDLQDKQGSSLVVILTRQNTLEVTGRPDMHLELETATEKFRKIVPFPKGSFYMRSYPTSGDLLAFEIGMNERNRLIVYYDEQSGFVREYSLMVNVDGFKADLKFEPLHAGFVPDPEDGGCFFINKKDPNKKNCAAFAAPIMKGSGVVTTNKRTTHFKDGVGYHDHPWGTDEIYDIYHEWHWGRLYNEEIGMMYADVKPQSEYKGKLKFMYFARKESYYPEIREDLSIKPSSWKRNGLFNIKFPHKLLVNVPSLDLEIETQYQKVLLNVPMYNRSEVNFSAKYNKGSSDGTGWTEYCKFPVRFHWLIGFLTKVKYWIWRFH